MFNGYRGTVNGAVQTVYTDQPGVASPGMIAFASDHNQVDAYLVGETEGVFAGAGIKFTAINDSVSLQRPNQAVFLPVGSETAADFGGVVVFDEAMQSDANGKPGWNKGRVSRILRPVRTGGRIYTKAIAAVAAGDPVYWVTSAVGSYVAGDFAKADPGTVTIGGTAVAGAGNTGDGTMGAITVDAGTKLGDYQLVCIEPATDAGKFLFSDPDGIELGVVTVAVAADLAGIAFTLADGATDFAAGDSFVITVAESGNNAVLLPNATWVSAAAAGEPAIIEFA